MNLNQLDKQQFSEFIKNCLKEVLKDTPIQIVESRNQTKELLSIQEASVFLNLSIATIYSKVSKKELPFIKRSKKLYFSSYELLDYLKQGRKKSNSEIEAEAKEFLSKMGAKNEK